MEVRTVLELADADVLAKAIEYDKEWGLDGDCYERVRFGVVWKNPLPLAAPDPLPGFQRKKQSQQGLEERSSTI